MARAATTWNIVFVAGPCLHSALRLRAENQELRYNVHGRQDAQLRSKKGAPQNAPHTAPQKWRTE